MRLDIELRGRMNVVDVFIVVLRSGQFGEAAAKKGEFPAPLCTIAPEAINATMSLSTSQQ